jgi:hypothetical protein
MSAHQQYRHRERVLWPNTTMANAYLIALTKWALAHHENLEARVTLPVGVVGAEELLNVLRALEKARLTNEPPRMTAFMHNERENGHGNS